MTVTLETKELYMFQSKLSHWYKAQVVYVLENLEDFSRDFLALGREGTTERLRRLMQRYEKENPQPSWKDLL